MSEGRCTVVRIDTVTKHENADSLDLIRVWDYPVIVHRGDFAPGDLAIYIPVDSMLPTSDARFAFLSSKARADGLHRLKAVRLRGIFSMGLLIPASLSMTEGDDVTDALQITRYEPPSDGFAFNTENEPDGSTMLIYTDIEGLRRWPNVLQAGENVVITEKLHGANGRFCWHDGRLWVGSHKQIKRRDPRNLWWRIAELYDMEACLARFPDMAIYGEVFGQVQDLRYGHNNDRPLSFAVFDVLDIRTRRYLDYAEFMTFTLQTGIDTVPVLYAGSWEEALRENAEGPTRLGGGHVREGIVVRPQVERYHDGLGRVILKQHGEGYLTRKEKKA